MSKYLFSIITPCYKSTTTLRRTFDSLKDQCKDNIGFEWIVVDDFSNDNDQTVSLIKELCREAPFPTKTIFLEKNYNSTQASPRGSQIAEGEYILILDHDDMLVEGAFQIFKNLIDQYKSEAGFVGVCGRCINMDEQFIGTKLPSEEIVSNELEIRHVYKVRGEMCQCTKREVFREYFKDFKPGYHNGYIWMQIARNYRYVYTNKVVRRYDTINPLSQANSKEIRYIAERIDMLRDEFVNYLDYLRHDKIFLVRVVMQYCRLSFYHGVSFKDQLASLPTVQKCLVVLLMPLGFLRYSIDRLRK